jgi:hypothetical protein
MIVVKHLKFLIKSTTMDFQRRRLLARFLPLTRTAFPPLTRPTTWLATYASGLLTFLSTTSTRSVHPSTLTAVSLLQILLYQRIQWKDVTEAAAGV